MKLQDINPIGASVKISMPNIRTASATNVRRLVKEAAIEVAASRSKHAQHGTVPPPGRARGAYDDNRLIVQFEPDVLRSTLHARASGSGAPTVLMEGSEQKMLLTHLRTAFGVRRTKPLFAAAFAERSPASTISMVNTLTRATLPGDAVPKAGGQGWTVFEFQDAAGTRRALETLKNDKFVRVVEKVPTRWLTKLRTPSAEQNRQWGLRAVGFFGAGVVSTRGVPVAVIDSGFDLSNPLLAGVVRKYEHYGWSATDLEQHGTHVVGTIAALVNDRAGVSGLCDSPIHAWKVIDDAPDKDGYRYVDFDDYAHALSAVAASGARALNLSIGGSASSRTEQLLFDELAKAGIFVAAAMGNEFEDGNPIEYPAAYKGVHAVCAVDEVGERAAFSNAGRHAFISAPGVNVLSTLPLSGNPTGLGCLDGTSMATPHVTAAAALIFAKFPDLTVAEVKAILAGTALPGRGQRAGTRSRSYGYGLLRLDASLLETKVAILRKSTGT